MTAVPCGVESGESVVGETLRCGACAAVEGAARGPLRRQDPGGWGGGRIVERLLFEGGGGLRPTHPPGVEGHLGRVVSRGIQK